MLGMPVPAVLAGVAVTIILGGYALLRSPGADGGRHATQGLTPPPVAVLPPSATQGPATQGPATPMPARTRRPHRTAARQPPAAHRPMPATTPAAAAAPSPSPSPSAA
jgi:hypothetical protein